MATKKSAKRTSRKKAAKRKRPKRARSRDASPSMIQGWTTDPMGGSPPIPFPAPTLPGTELPTRIVDPAEAPPPRIYDAGTAEFRYWTAAEALRRAAGFWSGMVGNRFHPELGRDLPVRLDDGVDLNAYYARNEFPPLGIKQGLSFFHDTVHDVDTGRAITVYSGESPDVVIHEFGHALLDAVKPALWSVTTTEAAAFHESFGDVAAILTALQLPVVAQATLEETGGRLWRNSAVSRVAEQLGYAIRQRSPGAVASDSLRNASNSFAYVDPTTLPSSSPASQLSREPHNFSRVFTGTCLEAFGGMVLTLSEPPALDDVVQASQDLGRLLVQAIRNAPVRTRFFQAVAEQLVIADSELFDGRYAQPLTTALVRRGLMPVRSMAAPGRAAARTLAEAAVAAARSAAVSTGGVGAAGVATAAASRTVRVALDGTSLGLPVANLFVAAPAVDDGPAVGVRGATPAEGVPPARYSAVYSFVESLLVRGRIAIEPKIARVAPLFAAITRKRATHEMTETDEGWELHRITFDCGR